VLAHEPDNPRARYYRGLTLQLLGEADDAVVEFDALSRSDAADGEPAKYAAWARSRLAETRDAVAR
jgi:hypothetical protein